MPTPTYAAQSATSPLAPHAIERRPPGSTDVAIDILYCGVCHSDLHTARGEWAGVVFPVVPGHEIVGRVSAVGADVKTHKPGDLVGVGCLVDSCRTCPSCQEHLEQYCENGSTGTYGGVEKQAGRPTNGGYSKQIVVNQDFVLRVPAALAPDLSRVAPLLCAGITTYSPLRHWQIGPGHRVAVLGLGGLGHMGVKIAAALGAEVTVLSTSPGKRADAEQLGAHKFVVTKNADELKQVSGYFDFILNTVSAQLDLGQYLSLLRRDGTMILVGAPPEALPVPAFSLIPKRRRLAGSMIGGIQETQEMLDFCAEHGILSDVEVIPISAINTAYERMLRADVKYRFVIDMATL